jgi:hypothetical protein
MLRDSEASTQSKDLYPLSLARAIGILRLCCRSVSCWQLCSGSRGCEWTRGGTKLDFQVNDETYFLDLEEDARKWTVFVETPTGTRQLPVYADESPFEDVKVIIEDHSKKQIVN